MDWQFLKNRYSHLKSRWAEQPSKTAIRMVECLLALSLFACFASELFHPHFVGVLRPFGAEINSALGGSSLQYILILFGCLGSIALAAGFRERAAALALLLTHFAIYSGYVTSGYELLVDPLLLFLIILPREQNSLKITSIFKIVAIAMITWMAWAQFWSAPWLENSVVNRYLVHSPFGMMVSKSSGFAPLVEIVGGFVWLLGLSAPLVLVGASFARVWAVSTILCQGFLELSTPLSLWNLVPVAVAILFLPAQWLTLNRQYWISQIENLHLARRAAGFVLVMSIMLFTIFDRNIAEQFDIFQKIGSLSLMRTYEIASNPFVKVGNLILFNSIWKMYSPVWHRVVWIEWFAKDQKGIETQLKQENFSPDYRLHRRTWSEALWGDFKKEKVFVGMLSTNEGKKNYGTYLCHDVYAQTGSMPVSIRAEINSFGIRGPEENWSLETQGPDTVQKDIEINCDSSNR